LIVYLGVGLVGLALEKERLLLEHHLEQGTAAQRENLELQQEEPVASVRIYR
jgi:hypothetical protein